MLSTLSAGRLTVRGLSVGGVYTALYVPELDLALDVGLAPRSFAGVRTLLLTHGHVDHVGALPTLLGIRALHGHPTPLRVVMPAEIVDEVTAALAAMSTLQHWPLAIEAIGLRPGDEAELRPDLLVRAHRAFHPVPCLAYQLIRRVKKLRPEHHHLPGPEIGRLRAAGADLFDVVDHLELAYATDSLVSVLDHNPTLYQSRVLLLEATFLDGRKSRDAARAGCHIHLDELIERAELFGNEHLLLMHVSQLYRPDEVDGILDARLPPGLRARTQVLVPPAGPWWG
ncbi:MAG: MBL fold metallo-hydrolase [Kofleriaceae bacterium]|nr:MBL fold metallo-hydrolase [Kofleriaceae bacterium]MBP6838118.1 MBL fold metallo-hydrolase [Kofleriaceae bacterium]